jgi:hypothetical protein
MLGACRPGRVYECVMQTLLNVVNHLLLEPRWIDREHSNAGNRFFHHRFVAASDGLDEILLQ